MMSEREEEELRPEDSLNPFLRQLTLVDSTIFNTPLSVIGAGNLGSVFTHIISKVGFNNITLWDRDYIDTHNLSNQNFPRESEGRKKVEVVASEFGRNTPHKYFIFSPLGFNFNQSNVRRLINSKVVICLVDTILARVTSFISCIRLNRKYPNTIKYFMEAGTHRNLTILHVIDLSDNKAIAAYLGLLEERANSKGRQPICTARATFHYATFSMSVLTGYLIKALCGEEIPYETIIDTELFSVVTQSYPSNIDIISDVNLSEKFRIGGYNGMLDFITQHWSLGEYAISLFNYRIPILQYYAILHFTFNGSMRPLGDRNNKYLAAGNCFFSRNYCELCICAYCERYYSSEEGIICKHKCTNSDRRLYCTHWIPKISLDYYQLKKFLIDLHLEEIFSIRDIKKIGLEVRDKIIKGEFD